MIAFKLGDRVASRTLGLIGTVVTIGGNGRTLTLEHDDGGHSLGVPAAECALAGAADPAQAPALMKAAKQEASSAAERLKQIVAKAERVHRGQVLREPVSTQLVSFARAALDLRDLMAGVIAGDERSRWIAHDILGLEPPEAARPAGEAAE